MEHFDALTVAAAEFERRLRAVRDDQWDVPTPCEDWTVRELVRHVVGGNRMSVALLDGASRDEALGLLAGVDLGDDPVATFVAAAQAQLEAFRADGALERTCHHPAGDMPAAQIIGFRIGDLTLHAWDLARAIGADESLDADLVQEVWDGLQPLAPIIGQIGMFGDGPSGDVPEDAPLQVRMLDLVGRRP
ncbi:MAG: TIGR03086 family metal-binding protein [Acidimicrobiales bacterium]